MKRLTMCSLMLVLTMIVGWMCALSAMLATGCLWKAREWISVASEQYGGHWSDGGYQFGPGMLWVPTIVVFVVVLVLVVSEK